MRKVLTALGALAGGLIGGLTATPASASGCFIGMGECHIPAGTIVCQTYSGLTASDRDVNAAQLESIGCVRTGRILTAGAVTEAGETGW
jgi:hypothetical protein